MSEGWVCPVCRRGVAPGEKSCDHGGQIAAPLLPISPGLPTTAPATDWTRTGWPPDTHPLIVAGGCIVKADDRLLLMNGPVQ